MVLETDDDQDKHVSAGNQLEKKSDSNFLESISVKTRDSLSRENKLNESRQHSERESPLNATSKVQEASGENVLAGESLADWGILACVFLGNIISGMNFTGFAVFYPHLVEHFDATTAAVGWCGSIHGFFQAFVSVFASFPIQSYGCRLPSAVGSFVFCVGCLLSFLAPNLTTIYFTYGLISGSGSALYTLSAGIIVLQRFGRNRTLASGIGLLGYSIGAAIGSFATSLLLQSYSWRSTFLILAAINFHRIPVCLLLRTPARFTSPTVDPNDDRISGRHTLSRYLRDVFDFSTLRHGRYSVFVAASTLQAFCQSAFVYHAVNRAVNVGLTSVQGVAAATTTSCANIASRVAVSFVANVRGVNPLHVFAIGMFTAALSIVFLCTIPGIVGTMICHVLFGISSGCAVTVTSAMTIHLMGLTNLPKCMAILQFAGGFPRLIASPLIGWVFDVTRDYNKAYAIIGCLALGSGSLMIVLTVVDSRQKKSVTVDSESPS